MPPWLYLISHRLRKALLERCSEGHDGKNVEKVLEMQTVVAEEEVG